MNLALRVFNNFQRLLEQCGEKSTAANVALGRTKTRYLKPVADLGVGSGITCQFDVSGLNLKIRRPKNLLT